MNLYGWAAAMRAPAQIFPRANGNRGASPRNGTFMAGRKPLPTKVYPLEQFAAALREIKERQVRGRIVLTQGDE